MKIKKNIDIYLMPGIRQKIIFIMLVVSDDTIPKTIVLEMFGRIIGVICILL
jgi:hypothetical protein